MSAIIYLQAAFLPSSGDRKLPRFLLRIPWYCKRCASRIVGENFVGKILPRWGGKPTTDARAWCPITWQERVGLWQRSAQESDKLAQNLLFRVSEGHNGCNTACDDGLR